MMCFSDESLVHTVRLRFGCRGFNVIVAIASSEHLH